MLISLLNISADFLFLNSYEKIHLNRKMQEEDIKNDQKSSGLYSFT